MSGFAVVDFETTGFVPERSDRVVEVGVVLLDSAGRKEEAWTTLVNPRRDIGASHIHGITASEVLDAPEFSEISDDLLELLAGRVAVAHNAPFDMRFLHRELLRAGYEVAERPRALCSMKWAGRLLGPAKLQHCCEALGIPLDDAHTAIADAEATGQLLAELISLGGATRNWEEDLDLARTFAWPSSRGRRTTRLAIRQNPREVQPSSWMADILADSWIPGDIEDEASYLIALGNALLDFHVSATEGRALAEIAQTSGLSAERVMELHREHLGRLAAEAWADGVLTEDEMRDLCAAATYMGLETADVTTALDASRNARETKVETFLQKGDRVVFTGEMNRAREAWIAEIVAAGLATGGVTKSTRVLVSADPDSLSGKAATARRYGIPVIDERAFERYFTEYLDADRAMAL